VLGLCGVDGGGRLLLKAIECRAWTRHPQPPAQCAHAVFCARASDCISCRSAALNSIATATLPISTPVKARIIVWTLRSGH
jgi:hypothetical protein